MIIHHGIKFQDQPTATRAIQLPSTAVIGLVATSSDADVDAFPLDRPVLITNINGALVDAGTQGTLKNALLAIADQTSPIVIVVRVATDADATDQAALVVGGNTDGELTGLQALLMAETLCGFVPKIIGAPGFNDSTVVAALGVLCGKLRAFGYFKPAGETEAAAITAAAAVSSKSLMPIWPDWTGWDGYAVAAAMGLRSKLDTEYGFVHKSISNAIVNGVSGITKDVTFSISGEGTSAAALNSAKITTLVRNRGFKFWGNRTCSSDTSFAFETAVRTDLAIKDMIEVAEAEYIDKPLTTGIINTILSGINAKFRAMTAAGQIMGGTAWFDGANNPALDLSDGKAKINYKFTPVAPLESLTLLPEITSEFYLNFAESLNRAG
jgi:uncharacterized protein